LPPLCLALRSALPPLCLALRSALPPLCLALCSGRLVPAPRGPPLHLPPPFTPALLFTSLPGPTTASGWP